MPGLYPSDGARQSADRADRPAPVEYRHWGRGRGAVLARFSLPLGPLRAWPVVRQLTTGDLTGRGDAARSPRQAALRPRTDGADRIVESVCPFCAVGCGQRVYVRGEEIIQIEGNPDSPISRGRLCPKGAATRALVTSPSRLTKVRYRPPFGTEWEDLPLDRAMQMIADRVIDNRRRFWEDRDAEGRPLRRAMGFASLGGATLDNEENYLIKKLFTALGAIQIENQARI
jgi:formate dehydrogenase major subunit